ncbi:hypothetical protein U9M48_045047 [Paspalum notatum var. saurae]|uniref:Uncharacterized protein n=1 Tax=Paspalum notatum var. saurae TaxID=547442 RepID=A0AAQ3UY56_PASNO
MGLQGDDDEAFVREEERIGFRDGGGASSWRSWIPPQLLAAKPGARHVPVVHAIHRNLARMRQLVLVHVKPEAHLIDDRSPAMA